MMESLISNVASTVTPLLASEIWVVTNAVLPASLLTPVGSPDDALQRL
jgi:hypothetical protein